MKLPLLNDYNCKDCYPEQLIAKHYLDGLLEGYMLEFTTTREIKYLGVETPYLKMDERLMNIIMTMIGVIKHQGLNLKFELSTPKGLFLHNHNPENDDIEEDDGCIDIGLRINGSTIECIDITN